MVPTGGPKYSITLLFGARLTPLPWLAWRDEWHRVRGFTLLPCDANFGGLWLFHHCLDFGTLEKGTLNLDRNKNKKSIKMQIEQRSLAYNYPCGLSAYKNWTGHAVSHSLLVFGNCHSIMRLRATMLAEASHYCLEMRINPSISFITVLTILRP
jgi:hypothetical protein